MKNKAKQPAVAATVSSAPLPGLVALDTYLEVLAYITSNSSSARPTPSFQPELPFLGGVAGLENLYLTMSAVAPAIPDADDEEWNPLSQRPHAPLPPAISEELGAEVVSMKEAVDAFTTLSHEMMHVALWEPFFAGYWRPRSRKSFREFSLMSEGFCFFFADIVVSGAVRVRLPDGEFAQDRETPSNAHFHPIRAFHSVGIQDHHKILDLYLDGFAGQSTQLSKAGHSREFATAMAIKIYNFYAGSLPYLNDLHAALASFGGLTEFYQRFCDIPGLPCFLDASEAHALSGGDFKLYFTEFFRNALTSLASLSPEHVQRVRWRRMLQMRAYYALQIRWFLTERQIVAQDWSRSIQRQTLGHIESYLEDLRVLLLRLGSQSPLPSLAKLDARYDAEVRSNFFAHQVWAGHRWLIAPNRAGGSITAIERGSVKKTDSKVGLLDTVEYIVDELNARLRDNTSVKARAEILAHVQSLASIGAAGASGSDRKIRAMARQLRKELAKPHLLSIWSLPLASFDPVNNQYRELLFSYK